ncbi:hypothetical protein CLV98_106131 [Dyadobacter jejuensis]|uniref:Uncharacterized protein n=1 Tax=Dyadobacter jejuensis TaxID=1082580 RepID=A0A316AK65_9BACT|nr:hypothetical protein [Dyadobacter jejuensis]PWJ57659.1 hypothetical protein CLV98_106131 [Dyadobacter jejuensis]
MLLKAWVIPLLYLDYEIRRDYIVANLCENRNRPELNCNGKCYLAKKIKSIREQERKEAEHSYVVKLIDVVARISEPFQFKSFTSRNLRSKAQLYEYRSPFKARETYATIFHPPIAA